MFAQYGLKRSMIIRSTIVLGVYAEDIVISSDDSHGITALKHYVSTYFHMKDLGYFRYFFGIEIARYPRDISVSKEVSH